jgi:hypothetical protein
MLYVDANRTQMSSTVYPHKQMISALRFERVTIYRHTLNRGSKLFSNARSEALVFTPPMDTSDRKMSTTRSCKTDEAWGRDKHHQCGT